MCFRLLLYNFHQLGLKVDLLSLDQLDVENMPVAEFLKYSKKELVDLYNFQQDEIEEYETKLKPDKVYRVFKVKNLSKEKLALEIQNQAEQITRYEKESHKRKGNF